MADNPIKYSDLFQNDGGIDKLIADIKKLEKTYLSIGNVAKKQLREIKTATESLKSTDKNFNEQIKANEKSVDALVQKMKLQEKEEKKLNALRQKAIKLKQGELKTEQALRIEIQNSTRALKNEIIIENEQKGSLKQLEAQLRRNIDKYRSLSKAERDNSTEGKKLLNVIKQQDTEVKNLNSTIGRSQGNVGNYTSAFKKLGGILGRGLGILGITAGVAGLARVVGSSIGIFSSFEKANSALEAVLGATQREMDLLASQAKVLGATTSFTATQVTELQTEFAKLGFPTSDIEQMTGSTLNAAAAMGSDLAETAKLTGATLKSFGLDSSEAARVNDVLAKSTTASALDFQKLSASMATIAPVANSFGFTVEDTTALLGQLSNAGFDASSAATATRKILLNLADSNGKLAKSLKEPVKDLPSLVRGLEQLKSEGTDLGEALELTDVKSVTAFTTFLNGTESLTKLSKSLQEAGGSAQRMADTQLDNLSGAVTILNSAWEGFILGLEDGNGLLNKFLRGIVEGTTAFLGFFTETEKVSDALEKERTALFSVEAQLFSTNTTTRERIKIIEDLQRQYPDFLKNIDAETVSNEQLVVALKKVNDQLVNKIIIERQQEKIDIQNEKVANRREKQIALRIKLLNRIAEVTRNNSEAQKISQDASIDEIEKAKQIIALLDTRSKLTRTLTSGAGGFAAGQNKSTSAVEKLREALNGLINADVLLKEEESIIVELLKDKEGLLKSLGIEQEVSVQATEQQIAANEEEIETIKGLIEVQQELKKVEQEKIVLDEKSLAAKNLKISAIDKEIARLQSLGVAEEEARQKRIEDLKKAKEKIIEDETKEAERIRILKIKSSERLYDELRQLNSDAKIDEIKNANDAEIEKFKFARQLQREKIEAEIGDEILKKQTLEAFDKQTERGLKKIDDKKKEEQKKAINEVADLTISSTLDALSKLEAEEEAKIDNKIQATDDQITKQQELAKDGLANTLAFEEAERAKLELQKLESDRKQIKLEKIKALYSAYSAAASSGDNNAIVNVIRDFAIIQGIESSLSSFGDGTGEHGTVGDTLNANKNGSSGGNSLSNGILRGESHSKRNRGIKILAEGGEGILTTSQMNRLGKDNFMKLTSSLDGGTVGSDIFAQQVAMIPSQSGFSVNLDGLKSEMAEVRKAIDRKPVPSLHAESIKDAIDLVHTERSKGKKVVSRYRIKKGSL